MRPGGQFGQRNGADRHFIAKLIGGDPAPQDHDAGIQQTAPHRLSGHKNFRPDRRRRLPRPRYWPCSGGWFRCHHGMSCYCSPGGLFHPETVSRGVLRALRTGQLLRQGWLPRGRLRAAGLPLGGGVAADARHDRPLLPPG
jgi:hypothetical protein